ncbi:hypothetical protein ACKE5C_03935 [Aneurinibacillus thermoaerophilus]|uniref:Uncharacterized protein n=1 Tax=Aneurinibacillus thermoaerophilus TaxID=143495 RepID=A0ABX8YE73_ANETH|nr:hypothetical protein [Aneurinibacillus thermoaerophilus]QYY43404.1 hypothetical protein K3F53_03900 [Aneurinibacillus thermoaerophilus]
MAYEKQTWIPHIVDPNKPLIDPKTGKQAIDPNTGRVLWQPVQEGTRFTPGRMNHMEEGIEQAHILIEQLAKEWGGNFVASPNGAAGFQFSHDGLTVSWTAGIAYVNGRRFEVPAGSMELNPTQGQYIYLDTDGTMKKTTSQATAEAGLLLWYFATDASQVITSTDKRKIITPDTYAKKEEVVMKEPGKGLSTNDYSDTEKGKVASHETRLQKIEEEMGEGTPFQTTVLPGMNIITVPRSTPFNVLNIKGRTLINLLGRDGNCESLTNLSSHLNVNVTATLDSTNKSIGSKSIKVTLNAGATSGNTVGAFFNLPSTTANDYYIFIGEIKNGNATQARIGLPNAGNVYSMFATDTTKFTTVYKKFIPQTSNSTYVALMVEGAEGQYAYFDALRLYKISEAEYNAIDNMTPEQIAQRWPYVDDIKGVRNPYIIRYGKNILPPFTEWTRLSSSTKAVAQEPYMLEIGADGDGDYVSTEFECLPNTSYTISATLENMYHGIFILDYYTPIQSYTEKGTFTFNTGNYTKLAYTAKAKNKTQIARLKNPMLNIRDTPLPFEPQNNDYQFFDVTLHSNTDGSVRDELFFRDGKPYKLKRFEELVLDGSYTPQFARDRAGFKWVILNVPFLATNGVTSEAYQTGIKYDGKILKAVPNSFANATSGDVIDIDHGRKQVYIAIPDTDSGWPEAWNGTTIAKKGAMTRDATAQDMIKAYFNGWKWDDANGRWYLPNDVNSYSGDVDFVTNNYSSYYTNKLGTPYRLLYQLAQPVEVPVSSEGEISLFEGDNLLEVGTGVVVREPVTPVYDSGSGNYQINSASNPLKNKISRVLSIYNGTKLTEFTTGVRDIFSPYYSTLGAGYGHVLASVYDPTAAYSATYIAEKYAYTAPLIDLQGEHRTKLAGVVAELAQDQADTKTDVDMIKAQYARKQQGPWVPAVLLNGWVNYKESFATAGYMKDEFGFVHIKGTIKSGVTTAGTVITTLPKGCRPKEKREIVTACFSPASVALLSIYPTGDIVADIVPYNTWLSLELKPFLAEQ